MCSWVSAATEVVRNEQQNQNHKWLLRESVQGQKHLSVALGLKKVRTCLRLLSSTLSMQL